MAGGAHDAPACTVRSFHRSSENAPGAGAASATIQSRIDLWEQMAAGTPTSSTIVEALLSEALDDFDGYNTHVTTAATPERAAAMERAPPPPRREHREVKTERTAPDAVEARVAAPTAATPERAAAMERAPVDTTLAAQCADDAREAATTAATPEQAAATERSHPPSEAAEAKHAAQEHAGDARMAVTTAEPKEAAATDHGAVARAAPRAQEPADARAVQLAWLTQQEAVAAEMSAQERWELEYQCGMHDPFCRKRRTGRRGGARHRRRTTCARSACAQALPSGACEQAARATTASATGAENTAGDAGGLQLEVSTLEVGGAARTLRDATRAEAAASPEATPRASCPQVPVEVPKEAHSCIRSTADPVGHRLPIGATVRLRGVDVGTALMIWMIDGKPRAGVVGGSSLSGCVGTVCGEPVHADECFGSPSVFVPVSWLSAKGDGRMAGFLAPCLERLLGGGGGCDWRAAGPRAMATRAAIERRLAAAHGAPQPVSCEQAAPPALVMTVAGAHAATPVAEAVAGPAAPVRVPWHQLVPARQDTPTLSGRATAPKAAWARPAVTLSVSTGDGWPALQAAAHHVKAQSHTTSAATGPGASGNVRRVLEWHEAQEA
jgi:chemotaxis protein histidine kinase CheA